MAEKFPNLWSDLDIQVHEASRSPQNFNPKWYSSRHIITELSKIKTKERMLKAEKWNFFSHKVTYPLLRPHADFLAETLQAGTECTHWQRNSTAFKAPKEKDCHRGYFAQKSRPSEMKAQQTSWKSSELYNFLTKKFWNEFFMLKQKDANQ